jgi:Galactose mutarotase-like
MRLERRVATWRAAASAVLLLSAIATAAAPSGAPETVQPQWNEAAPGVWEATVGVPERLTLLGAAGQRPKQDGLAKLPRAEFPLAAGEVRARVSGGKVALRFPLAADEEIYGLGVDFKSLRRTGATMRLHVDHWGGVPGRTHAPVPLYVSSRGYGVLVDSARYVDFYVGTAVRLAAERKPPVIDRQHPARACWCSPGPRRSTRCAATTSGAAGERCRPSGASAS